MPQPFTLHPRYLPTGTKVGLWTVVRLLGSGAFGAVYEVERDACPYALKIALSHPQPDDAQALRADARAEREATCLRLVKHPNIVRIHDEGRWPHPETGYHYFVMDLVEGVSLADWPKRTRITAWRVARLFLKLARAVDEAHQRGVLHRDLKLENILVRSADEEPVIVDFGAAEHSSAYTLTEAGLPPGTPRSRSPEAAAFERQGRAGAGESYVFQQSDDLYALGVALYEVVTGGPLFPEHLSRQALMRAIEQLAPQAPRALNPRVPLALDLLTMRLLAKSREDRFASAAHLVEELERELEAADASWDEPLFLTTEEQRDPAHRETETALRPPVGPPLPTSEEEAHLRRIQVPAATAAPPEPETPRPEAPPRPVPAVLQQVESPRPEEKPTPANRRWAVSDRKLLAVVALTVLAHLLNFLVLWKKDGPTPPPPVEAAQPEETDSMRSHKDNDTLKALTTVSLMGLTACTGVPLRPDGSPGPQDCPEGAKAAMRELAITSQHAWSIFIGGTSKVWDNYVIADGDVDSFMPMGFHGLPEGTRLRGKVWTGGPRAIARYYEAILPDGTLVPFCGVTTYESGNLKRLGIPKFPGPRPGTAILPYGNAAFVRVVDAFE
ncbi:MAG TPA: serine/threonine-protein kinase [Archangium sp.]|jgi:serine/threonine-protein kinase|uniref:serine/threonine-protein kinase n=1 Tax=Archangium sp. TaxID=1872627 RepID=UPI002ED817BB